MHILDTFQFIYVQDLSLVPEAQKQRDILRILSPEWPERCNASASADTNAMLSFPRIKMLRFDDLQTTFSVEVVLSVECLQEIGE